MKIEFFVFQHQTMLLKTRHANFVTFSSFQEKDVWLQEEKQMHAVDIVRVKTHVNGIMGWKFMCVTRVSDGKLFILLQALKMPIQTL